MFSYYCSENMTAPNKKVIKIKVDGIEAAIEKKMEDQNRHNVFYYYTLPSIHADIEDLEGEEY